MYMFLSKLDICFNYNVHVTNKVMPCTVWTLMKHIFLFILFRGYGYGA